MGVPSAPLVGCKDRFRGDVAVQLSCIREGTSASCYKGLGTVFGLTGSHWDGIVPTRKDTTSVCTLICCWWFFEKLC